MVGTNANAINTDVVTLLLSSSAEPSSGALGGVYSAYHDISALGTIYDNAGQEYILPFSVGQTIYCEVEAWTGNDPNYFVASLDPGAFTGVSQIFTTILVPLVNINAADVSDVGIIDLAPIAVPEPSACALASFALLSASILFRRKSV